MGVERGMLWLVVLFVVAVAFWAAGGLLLYVRHRTSRKVDLMRQTQSSGASGVSEFSPGASVEVKGMLRCESPLQSEMAGESCACYFSRVTREYVRSSGPSSDDSPGSHRSRQTASETLSEAFMPCRSSWRTVPAGSRCTPKGPRSTLKKWWTASSPPQA